MLSKDKKEFTAFKKTVWQYYRKNGRHDLPWRKTQDPYKILVSEMMLQQTQVERVQPKYKSFLKKWGTTKKLAAAPLSEVLKEWQGLGYNRRAKMLHTCASIIINDNIRKWPDTYDELVALPGIGPYTAGAIMAFAHNEPVSVIETNIRTVYLHHFFKNQADVTDKELLQLITATCDQVNPREWYWALMDYGAFLKKEHGNPNRKSKHYTKQSTFNGSDRQIRGAIVRSLAEGERPYTRKQLHKLLHPFEDIRIDAQLLKLTREEMIVEKSRRYQLPS